MATVQQFLHITEKGFDLLHCVCPRDTVLIGLLLPDVINESIIQLQEVSFRLFKLRKLGMETPKV